MIRRDTFINKIRDLDYTYKSQQKRTYLWRKKGGTHFISVPMRDFLEETFVANALRQAGCGENEIADFIAQYHT